MESLILLSVWLTPAIYVHLMYAISLGASQRLGLLASIRDNDPVKLNMFDCVSLDSHLWRVATLRNPWKIYPAGLRDEIWRVS